MRGSRAGRWPASSARRGRSRDARTPTSVPPTGDGRVLVSDFGVALRATDTELTVDGTVIGTPSYMSPEQCAGRRAEPQSDQYSLGVVGFQMLAGDVPFHADTIVGMMQHHCFTA